MKHYVLISICMVVGQGALCSSDVVMRAVKTVRCFVCGASLEIIDAVVDKKRPHRVYCQACYEKKIRVKPEALPLISQGPSLVTVYGTFGADLDQEEQAAYERNLRLCQEDFWELSPEDGKPAKKYRLKKRKYPLHYSPRALKPEQEKKKEHEHHWPFASAQLSWKEESIEENAKNAERRR